MKLLIDKDILKQKIMNDVNEEHCEVGIEAAMSNMHEWVKENGFTKKGEYENDALIYASQARKIIDQLRAELAAAKAEIERLQSDNKIFAECNKVLNEEVERLRDSWISVEERSPQDEGIFDVRIKLSDGSEMNCWSQSDGDFWWKPFDLFIDVCKVTHWQPIQPPKEGS